MSTADAMVNGMTKIEGGFRIRQVGNYYLDVLAMLWGNWRLVTTPVDATYCWTRGWCYRGGQVAFVAAVGEALAWPEDNPDHVPDRWFKEVHTGRRQQQYFEGP